MKTLTIAAGLASLASASLTSAAIAETTAETPVLTVYTYDSFVSEWGPGPAIEEAFEATCGCDLKFVAVGDGAEIMSRLRLEGARSDADVALGLDTSLMGLADATGMFKPAGVKLPELDMPVVWDNDTFLPFDWGWFAFVYDKTKVAEVPTSLEALAASDLKVIIEDPRTSTPGLGLVHWVKAVFGEDTPAYWESLNDNIVTVTKGWTEAYGMFLEGEADMVLSYTTSPAYHLIAEGDDTKAAAAFTDGHYMQVELAAKVTTTDQEELADLFLGFLLTDKVQAMIPETNWMYPAVTPEAGLPAGFDTLVKPKRSLLMMGAETAEAREAAIREWLAAAAK